MSGIVSSVAETEATVHTPHNMFVDHQRHSIVTPQQSAAFPTSAMQQQHHSYSHYQNLKQPHPLTHMFPSPTAGLPLLPPHIHSMLYHSVVGHAGKLLPSPQTGKKKMVPMSKPSLGATAAVSGASALLFSRGPVVAPSPYSANTSLGNGSGSPSTARELQATDTKRQLYTSPLVCSPGVGVTQTGTSPAPGLTGRALEELLAAESSELVQILLELSSCSAEAARFIESKAHLFALRHATRSNGVQRKGDKGVTKGEFSDATTSATVPERHLSVSLGLADRCCVSAETTPSKPLVFEDDSFLSNSCNRTGSAVDVSVKHTPFCNSNSAQALLLTPLSQYVTRKGVTARQNPTDSTVADVFVPAEERPWCGDVHPCLRWYGSCRHSTNCPFASSPRNFCLNWVRGSCVAGTNCNGVHRLPDACPADVRTLFDLGHGADRHAVARERLQQDNRPKFAATECDPRKHDMFDTPQDQIVVDPVSIPASLEHYHHVLRLSDDESGTRSSGANEGNDVCNCRGCCGWSGEFDWNSELRRQESSDGPQFPLPSPPPSVPRCLDDSFAAAADAEEDTTPAATTTRGGRCAAAADVSTRQRAAACGGDSDDEGVGFPPCNVLTRTQSPVAL